MICPKGPGDPAYAELDGVRLYKYQPAPQAAGLARLPVGVRLLLAADGRLAVKAWRRDRFDVLQACNPPDTYWALARLCKPRGVRFVYDQHDLNPEVFRSRFGEPAGLAAKAQYAALLWLERMTYRTADHVVSTNESYRDVALRRGGRRPAEVTVVRSGPDTGRMRPVRGRPELRRGAPAAGRLPRHHGPAGRRRPGAAGAGRAGAPARADRPARRAARLRRLPGRAQGAGHRAGAGRPRHLHRPGRPADDRGVPVQRATSACPRTRRARSTTSPR